MARQRSRSLGTFLVLFVMSSISAALDDGASRVFAGVSSQLRPYITSRIPRDQATSMPTSTPSNPLQKVMSTASAPSWPLATALDPSNLDRRDRLGVIISTISSLQNALASARASASSLSDELSSAISVSEELVSSLNELRSSTESLSLSASSALLVARASASSALSSAEASAAMALSAAQESAASSISEAMALATSIVGTNLSNPTNQSQKGVSHDKTSVSPAVVGGAVAASVVGSSLLSFIAVWLYLRKRKAKQRELEEENEVNAALDRAIVSYIVKEHPSPQGSAGYGTSGNNQMREHPPGDEKPEDLEPIPLSPLSPQSPPLSGNSGQALISDAFPELETERPPIPTPSPRSGPPPRPPRPAPLSLLPQDDAPPSPRTRLPAKAHKSSKSLGSAASSTNASFYDHSTASSSTGVSRAFSRQTASSHFMDEAEKVYGDILTSPLEINSPPPQTRTRTRPRRNTEPSERSAPMDMVQEQERREDVGWPLTKQPWV
ncbi:hypothetical protein QBC38DRAFT_200155 [Podospora fimiseda]|uniref:Transmembrane protein n=1 Tax=Podospora fimiseda TaxID=252190 RepID=A0AAN7BPI9_9PEZI|nr:hypothetical protein QBC38DRAFT_200155 [Podospora fimiseda]